VCFSRPLERLVEKLSLGPHRPAFVRILGVVAENLVAQTDTGLVSQLREPLTALIGFATVGWGGNEAAKDEFLVAGHREVLDGQCLEGFQRRILVFVKDTNEALMDIKRQIDEETVG